MIIRIIYEVQPVEEFVEVILSLTHIRNMLRGCAFYFSMHTLRYFLVIRLLYQFFTRFTPSTM